MFPLMLHVDYKVKFRSEKQRYTVQARNDRFAVCTKPFNPRKTVLYTIVDWDEQVRGPEDLVFGIGAETRQECENMLARLSADPLERTEVSHRRRIPLDIEEVWCAE